MQQTQHNGEEISNPPVSTLQVFVTNQTNAAEL